MEPCDNKNCGSQNTKWPCGCLARPDVENCNKYEPLKAKTEPVAKLHCSAGLSAIRTLWGEYNTVNSDYIFCLENGIEGDYEKEDLDKLWKKLDDLIESR